MAAVAQVGGVEIQHSGPAPYTARSASDRNPDWPLWIVVDAVGFNGIGIRGSLAKLFDRETAMLVAASLNDGGGA